MPLQAPSLLSNDGGGGGVGGADDDDDDDDVGDDNDAHYDDDDGGGGGGGGGGGDEDDDDDDDDDNDGFSNAVAGTRPTATFACTGCSHAHTRARGGAGGEGAPMQAPGLQRLSPAPAAQARRLQALQHHEPLHCSLLRW